MAAGEVEHIADISKRNRRSTNRLDNSFHKYTPEVTARPVDTYVHHQAPEDAGRNYRSLAASLAGIAPAINQFLKQKHDEQVAKDEATGTRLYHETGGERLSWEDWRKKHDKRLEETGVSTSVRNGYLKARMANEANIFRESVYNAYNSGEAKVTLPDGTVIPVSEADDPAVFNLWLNRFTAEYIRTNLGKDADPEYFAKIFVPQLERTSNEVMSHHINERNNVLTDRQIGENNKLIAGALVQSIEKDGYLTTDPQRRKETISAIQNSVRDMLKSGVPRNKVTKTLAETLVGLAMDPTLPYGEEILYMAQDIMIENGVSLWDTDNNALFFYRQMEQIKQNRRYRNNQEKEELKEEADKAAFELYQYVEADQPIPLEVARAFMEKYGTEAYNRAVSQFRNIHSSYRRDEDMFGNSVRDDRDDYGRTKEMRIVGNQFYNSIIHDVFSGKPVSIQSIINDPRWELTTPSERTSLLNLFNKQDKPEPENKALKEFNKEIGTFLSDTADAYLSSLGIDKKTDPMYETYKLALMSIPLNTARELLANPEALQNRDAVMATVIDKMHTVGQHVMNNKDLLNEIAAGNVSAFDIAGASLLNQRRKEQEAINKEAKADALGRQTGSVLYRVRRERTMNKGKDTRMTARQLQQSMFKGQQQQQQDKKQPQPKQEAAASKDAPTGKDFFKQMVSNFKAVTGRFKDWRAYRKGQHNGIDVSAPEGSSIRCPDLRVPSFTVTQVLKNNKTAGNSVRMEGRNHRGETVEITINHMKSMTETKKGRVFYPGNQIGLVGSTGKSSGPHMDLKIKVNGKYVDPETYDFFS